MIGRKWFLAASISVALLAYGQANAGTVKSALTGGPNTLSDEDREYVAIDAPELVGGVPTFGTISVGDVIRGIVGFNTISNANGTKEIGGANPTDELTGVFELLVVGKTLLPGLAQDPSTPGVDYEFTFAPAPVGTFPERDAANANVPGGPLPAGTITILWDDPANNYSPDGVAIPVAEATAIGPGTGLFATFGILGGAYVLDTTGDGVADTTALGESYWGRGIDSAVFPAGSTHVGGGFFWLNKNTNLGQIGNYNLLPQAGSGAVGPGVDLTGVANLRSPIQGQFPQWSDTTATIIVPLPASLWSGLGLLGCLALSRVRRWRA